MQSCLPQMTLHQPDLGTAVAEHATAKLSSLNIKKKNVLLLNIVKGHL